MGVLLTSSKVWITFGPIVVINSILLMSLIIYSLTHKSKKHTAMEAAGRTKSKFLSAHFKEWWVWMTDPIARFFVKLGMGPNAVSFIGFLWSVAAAILFAKGLFGYAGWCMIFGATFDIFDGRVARLTNRVTKSGAYFDSTIDRFGEGVCFIGLAYFFRASWLLPFVIAGLIGSMMVSYTRARAESLGVECKVGSMQRPERIVYLGVASVLTPLATNMLSRWWAEPLPILVIGAIMIIAVMTNATAIYRMVYSMTAMDNADKRDIESIPQIISRLSTPEGRGAFWERARYGYDRSKSRYSNVVLFMVDGVQPEPFEALIRAGELPHISRHLIERGVCARATGTFPSTTGPTATPFVTGCFPGTCDLPGARWFDRTIPEGRLLTMNRFRDYLGWGAYAMDSDLSISVRTIFEYSRRATNIFGMLNRGCGLSRDPAFFRLYSMFRRARARTDVEEVFRAAHMWFREALGREADCVYYTLPQVDFVREEDDPRVALESYRRIDDAVGKAVSEIKARDLYDRTALLFSSGFSRADARSTFDLNGFLGQRYSLFAHPGKPREWLEADAIAASSGTSMTHLYLRHNGSWNDQSFFEEIERRGLVGALLERAQIDVLAGRSTEGGIVVASRRGKAHVVEDPDGRVTYLIKGSDPFGYQGVPQVMKVGEVPEHTEASDYPDGIVQILQLFRSQRSGDLVISADPTCVLNGQGDQFTHGSLARKHLEVPLVSSVPVDRAAVRTADVFSLILNLLGIETEHHIDGRIVGTAIKQTSIGVEVG